MKLGEPKAGARDHLVDLVVEVAAADAVPEQIEPVLPRLHAGVRGKPVLDDEEHASRPQHPPRLRERPGRIR